MTRTFRAAALIRRGSLFVCALAGLGQHAFGQQYPFLPVAGSPKGVTTLFQDSKGRIWLGGIDPAVFDGGRFYPLRDYGLPPGEVYSTMEDSSGAIWIGSENGLYRYANGRIAEIGKAVVTSVAVASPDLVFASVGPLGKGIPQFVSLARIQRAGGVWKVEMVMPLDSPGPLTMEQGGSLLYPLFKGEGWEELRAGDLTRWPRTRLTPKSHPISGISGYTAGPRRVIRDRQGCVWIGGGGTAYSGSTTYTCDGKTWLGAPFENADTGFNLNEAPDGSMVLMGGTILAIGRPGSFRIARTANGLPNLAVAIQGHDGTVWIGGPQGLFRFASPFQMEYWTARDGVNAPWSVERNGSRIYAGLGDQVGVLTKDRRGWQTLPAFPDIGNVANLRTTKEGNLLVALNIGGAALMRPDGTLLAKTSYPAMYGLRLAILPDNETWLGGIGLSLLTRAGSVLNMAYHKLQSQQPSGNVLGLQYEDHTHRLWACYNGGLVVRYEDGTWREITAKDGLLTSACWTLAALPNGDVWYGYYNTPAFALIRPDTGGRFTVHQFRASDEIRDPETLLFALDHRRWIWRGGNHGMSVADAAEAEGGRWLSLDQSDGLSGEGINTGSFFADADGSVWFGADISIVHYQPPADLLTPSFSPTVFLSSFSWDGQSPEMADAVGGIPSGTHALAHIGSLQFDRRNALRVRYRILPEQTAWRSAASLEIPLGLLSSGTHTLEVQGRVFTGPWSTSISQSITVLVPLWRSWPLLLAYLVTTIAAATAALFQYRRNKADDAVMLPDIAERRLMALLPEVGELAGTLLDSRFEVGGLIGRGGFANVMDGYDRLQKERCAIKVFRSEVDKDWVRRSFEREVAALQSVRHPNVVSIYAHGSVPSGAPYLVMEFIDGRSLREVIGGKALASARTATILRQLASALNAIHAEGVYHRDVTPENVIVCNEGLPTEQAILIDFSIAIVKDANEALHGLSRAAGTFDYMAPEQAIGHARAASDIYSLARVTIEMLTGRKASDLLPPGELDLPEPVRILLKGLTIPLSEASVEMLSTAQEYDPKKRPNVASSFAGPIVRDLESDSATQLSG